MNEYDGNINGLDNLQKLNIEEHKLKNQEEYKFYNIKRREKCAEESRTKLYHIIENWDFTTHGTISQSKIVKNNPISKKTLEKYYREFKQYIQELNITFKLS
jgi:hypothetical protein